MNADQRRINDVSPARGDLPHCWGPRAMATDHRVSDEFERPGDHHAFVKFFGRAAKTSGSSQVFASNVCNLAVSGTTFATFWSRRNLTKEPIAEPPQA